VSWSNGSVTRAMRRQRPALIFDAAGGATHLITGVNFAAADFHSTNADWTLVTPLQLKTDDGDDARARSSSCRSAGLYTSSRPGANRLLVEAFADNSIRVRSLPPDKRLAYRDNLPNALVPQLRAKCKPSLVRRRPPAPRRRCSYGAISR